MLTYSIHIKRAFEGLVELGYLEVTEPGHHDRQKLFHPNDTPDHFR